MEFFDMACPRCGQPAGQGEMGEDVVRPMCNCAGTARLDERDGKILNKLRLQHRKRNREGAAGEN